MSHEQVRALLGLPESIEVDGHGGGWRTYSIPTGGTFVICFSPEGRVVDFYYEPSGEKGAAMSPVWNPKDKHLLGLMWNVRVFTLVLLVVFAVLTAQGWGSMVPVLLFMACSWLPAEVLYWVAQWRAPDLTASPLPSLLALLQGQLGEATREVAILVGSLNCPLAIFWGAVYVRWT